MDEQDIKRIKLSGVILVIAIILFIITKILPQPVYQGDPHEAANYYAKQYYSNEFYKKYIDKKYFLESMKESGVAISLNYIILLYELDQLDTFKNCNLDNGNVVYYPVAPFNKEDVKIEINLECDV